MNNLMIAVDRPCIVYQMEDIVDAASGEKVSSRKGDPIFVASYSAAMALTQEKIQTKIRKDNIYDTYVIYEQKAIAKAKEPPVVFESE